MICEDYIRLTRIVKIWDKISILGLCVQPRVADPDPGRFDVKGRIRIQIRFFHDFYIESIKLFS